MREILEVPVRDLMTTPAITVSPTTTIEALTALMQQYEYNGFPVVNDVGALLGLVTRLDLFKLYLLPYRRFIPAIEDTWVSSVGAIMSRGVVALYGEEPAIKAIALMVEHGIRTIPIVAAGVKGPEVVGVLTRRDLAAALKA